MIFTSTTFIGGLLMGLTSSLHCAAMCGAIASSLMFSFDRGGRLGRAVALFGGQTGRIAAYVVAGSILGFAGSSFYGVFDRSAAHEVLRWIGAMALAWIGLSVAGFTPSVHPLYRVTGPLVELLDQAVRVVKATGGAGALLSGLVWGCAPCGMVYGALFYAMLSGSAASGASVMLGFGFGTLPSVTAVAFGMSRLRDTAKLERVRILAGLSIAAVAVVSISLPPILGHVLCRQ